ncbi:multiple sugar transport system permease protein [Thermosporothrix hazakensis]|jgi:multiple sugar transport system permease protein|uniref:Multiple sugar transport system permease protein n=2 Tax=Thermosporothrix TaxID=768650 RepID=A0A326UA64_THEHA|nr:carbohydrate ABC transporter permease [Thermosporothrix hazakensis]PZW32024.1 multiple sugar transport system permease protein [Thermosporothrix hazakensis]BBH91503.1 sugar ABC transporter permease [Thermosporothrix sp. COM3]GCE49648.1 sugar ABC transporter permease [Thermosporothrix hazakensis]
MELRATPTVRKAPFKPSTALAWLVLIVTSCISLWPMYWLFVTALTPTTYTLKTPPDVVPLHASLSNFERLLTRAPDYWSWGFNSFLISIAITLFHLLFDTMAGYAFAKRQFPGRNILFWIIVATLMVPAYVTLVPMYIVTRELDLLNSLWAVILPGFANVFGIFLMRQYIQTLPSELLDAARIDGCNELQVFWHVILPLCKPAIGALAIFTFVRHWNDFLWPLIVLSDTASFTLPVGVNSLQSEFSTDYGIIFAGAALAALPMIVFFLIFQRYFLEGVRMGALKG